MSEEDEDYDYGKIEVPPQHHQATSPKSSPKSSSSRTTTVYASLFLVALTLENTASMLCRRYAVGILKLDFSKNTVLCVNEFIKLGFSLFMKYRQFENSFTRMRLHLLNCVVRKASPMLVPALVYLVVNLISYPSLQRVDVSVFSAISNLKVLATAVFAQMLLDSQISNRVWRTLVQLMLGVTLISWESSPNNPIVHKRVHQNWYQHVFDMFDLSYALGVFLALLQTFLSGFGSVCFEKVMKTGRKMNNQSYQNNDDDSKALSFTNVDVCDRNIQLALCSICIYSQISIWETKGDISRLDTSRTRHRSFTRNINHITGIQSSYRIRTYINNTKIFIRVSIFQKLSRTIKSTFNI